MSSPQTPQESLYQPVKPDVNLPKQEEEILNFWEKHQIFQKTMEASRSQKSYSFYDGPPFATGLPHYGHLLAGTLKDIVPRYYTMKGYNVARRFGWDCHGLPVENEINKAHNLKSRKEILAYGVANYNDACRSIVQRYSTEWKKTVRRVGRWVDMENAYFTMDVNFMQSTWWVFKQLFDKGLIYEGYKVVPYSTGLSTPLSNFEANLNYKVTQDPALTVGFRIKSDSNTMILAWTTTPWTLPSNMALAVGSEFSYVKVKEVASGKYFIAHESLWKNAFKEASKEGQTAYEVIETLPGSKLVGLEYEPLFPFFKDKKGAFKVIHSDHVKTDSGTGVVHMAPAFGEEDYYACLKNHVPIVNPVDDDGLFTEEVTLYVGKKVKEADKEITLELKKNGNLIKQETIDHSYPFCWRTETPLIYRAVSSMFVAVEKIKEDLLKSNSKTSWVPDHLRDGRFGNWLENARDWAITRNRFWGTPLPIWKNKEGEVICIGSKEELEKLSGAKINDLHMQYIDHLTIPSPTGKSPLKRVEGVLDCWFESGSMPYAQWGYPYQNKDKLKDNFPADFIAEGLDQTRGWFYTLMVIGTALFGESPFKNVIVNGLVLAEDGKKMSKSLKNYPDPMEVLDRHGADALRLYMIDSPVVKAQELKFSETGVKDIVRKILLRWWNSYGFFVNYANVDQFKPKITHSSQLLQSPNLLDQWVLSKLHRLIQNTEKEMNAYRLYNVVPALLNFVEELTNTYIRFNRSHFWSNGMPTDKVYAYETLYYVLTTLSKLMAPFAPFISEVTHQNLKRVNPASELSVHLEKFPEFNSQFLRPELEEAVSTMDALVTLGRNHREKIGIKAKIPLNTMKVIHREKRVLENLKRFEPYFKDELNMKVIEYVANEDDYIQITAKANFPALGKRLGPKMKSVGAGIQKLGLSELLKLEKGESLLIEGESITLAEVEIRRAVKGENKDISTHQLVSIYVDPSVHKDQELEGLAREVLRKIQQARKNADLRLDAKIYLELALSPELTEAVQTHTSMIQTEALCDKLTCLSVGGLPQGTHTEVAEFDEYKVGIGIKVV